jgi:hypothetical protein
MDTDFIQIIIKPTLFDPFAGRGYINLKFSDSDNGDKARIDCEIIPTSMTKNGVYLLTFLLMLLTLLGLLISHDFNTFLTIALGWTMLVLVSHFDTYT